MGDKQIMSTPRQQSYVLVRARVWADFGACALTEGVKASLMKISRRLPD